MLKHISEFLAEDPSIDPSFKRAMQPEPGTVAEAFQAQDVLAAMVQWHQKHEDANLPIQLLALLWAARRVC